MTFKIKVGQKISIGGEIWRVKKKNLYGYEGNVLLVNKKGSTFEVMEDELKPVEQKNMMEEVIN